MRSTLLHTGMGYVYSLDDEYDGNLARIEVSQLRLLRGSLVALLSVSSTITTAKRLPGTNRVTSAEVWLLNDRSRQSFSRYLSDLIPAPDGASGLDWNAVLEDVCQQVVAAENRPLRLTRLTPDMASSTEFLVPGLLPKGKPTILYGAGGTGKSAFAAALTICLELGKPFLGLPVIQSKVLYLDWETDEGDIAFRMNAAARGMGLTEAPPVNYVSLVRPIEDQTAQLAALVAQECVDVVIIDSVGMAMASAKDGADASDGAIRFFRALRSLKASVLAIDHISGEDVRRGNKGAPKPYGSVYKWNSARNAFEIRVSDDTNPERLVLKHRKSNLGPKSPDAHILYQWSGDEVRFSVDAQAEDEKVMLPPLDERILDCLILGPQASPRQIVDLLVEDDETVNELLVRVVLKRLLGDGKVHVMADGSIRLARPTQIEEADRDDL